jgi:hypothetical protein
MLGVLILLVLLMSIGRKRCPSLSLSIDRSIPAQRTTFPVRIRLQFVLRSIRWMPSSNGGCILMFFGSIVVGMDVFRCVRKLVSVLFRFRKRNSRPDLLWRRYGGRDPLRTRRYLRGRTGRSCYGPVRRRWMWDRINQT